MEQRRAEVRERDRGQLKLPSLPPLPPPEDPATMVAISICVVNKMTPPRVYNRDTNRLELTINSRHPSPCRWCEYEIVDQVALVDEFMEKSGQRATDKWVERLNPDQEPPRLAARVALFQQLSRERQRELVRGAQGYPESS